MIDPGLTHKTVLITGANHGIGAAAARALAQQGANVFITYYREKPDFSKEELVRAEEENKGGYQLYQARQQHSAEPLVKELRKNGVKADCVEMDLSAAAKIPELFDICEEKIGPVDVLINNHTYCKAETFDPDLVSDEGIPVSLPDAESIDKHFQINARAYALLIKEYVKRYLEREATWGRIINVSTDAAHAHPANLSYAASKHAIESYTRSAAAELGKYGITVNILSPGPVQTGYISPELEEQIAEDTPLGRVGYPEDLADVFVFLASDQAHWVSGQLLYVGGGYRMHQ